MSSPRPSWRPLLAGTIALFLVILAFLAGQVRAGADPALGRDAQQTVPQSTPSAPDGSGSDDGFVPGGTAPAPPAPNGSAPDESAPDESAPDESAPDSQSPSSDAPTTQQS
jgi:hypothetical protein